MFSAIFPSKRFKPANGLLHLVIVLCSLPKCFGSLSQSDDSGSLSELGPDYALEQEEKYPDYHVPEGYDHTVYLNVTFRKCFCNLGYVWNGKSCQPSNQTFFLPFRLHLTSTTHVLSLQDLSIRPAKPSKCTNSSRLIELHLPDFFILSTGDLVYVHGHVQSLVSKAQYCIDGFTTQGHEEVRAFACIDQPRISHCCFEEDNSSECSHQETFSFPTLFGRTQMFWEDLKSRQPRTLACPVHENLTSAALTTSSKPATLVHHLREVVLEWIPPVAFKKDPVRFSNDKFCLFRNKTTDILNVFFCYADPFALHEKKCSNYTCVRKCCPPGHAISLVNPPCEATENELWEPDFRTLENLERSSPIKDLHMEYTFPWCANGHYILDPEGYEAKTSLDKFYLLNNGSLYVPLYNSVIHPSRYCIDVFRGHDASGIKVLTCFPDSQEEDQCNRVQHLVQGILLVTSCVFLAVTLTVYATVPDLHAKLHGKCLLSHVGSLLLAYLCQLKVLVGASSLSIIACKVFALGTQVSFLAAFFWLNVMCFDIWWTLRSMKPGTETKESSRRRFIGYSVYAWGSPLAIGVVTAAMQFLPDTIDKTTLILPGFGKRGCWFHDNTSTWLYFHGFTLVLYVANIFFFFHVAAILIKAQKSTQGILKTSKRQHKERIWLYLKLFIVMGITWVCEVASWLEGTCVYWVFADIINSLQGVFIFFTFMCNKNVFQKVKSCCASHLTKFKKFVVLGSEHVSSEGRTQSQRISQISVETSERRSSTTPSGNSGGMERVSYRPRDTHVELHRKIMKTAETSTHTGQNSCKSLTL